MSALLCMPRLGRWEMLKGCASRSCKGPSTKGIRSAQMHLCDQPSEEQARWGELVNASFCFLLFTQTTGSNTLLKPPKHFLKVTPGFHFKKFSCWYRSRQCLFRKQALGSYYCLTHSQSSSSHLCSSSQIKLFLGFFVCFFFSLKGPKVV